MKSQLFQNALYSADKTLGLSLYLKVNKWFHEKMLEDANVDYFNELDWISKLLEIVGKTLVDIKEDGFEK